MIVPMKKVSLVVMESEKKKALKILRRLGILHIEEMSGSGERLEKLRDQISLIESSVFILSEKIEKNTEKKTLEAEKAIELARDVLSRTEETKSVLSEKSALSAELERLKGWGKIDPEELGKLSSKGIDISLHEMSPKEFDSIGEDAKTIVFDKTKNAVKFLLVGFNTENEVLKSQLNMSRVKLPEKSTKKIKEEISALESRLKTIEEELRDAASYTDSLKEAAEKLGKDAEFEVYSTGIKKEKLSKTGSDAFTVSYFTGYLPADDLPKLQSAAKENAWGLMASDPTEEDDVPTKIHNNKFISLIYPLTDFLGTVPGYFEYDISGWFLGFILIFFGIIFGDGGYGLLICAVAGAMIFKAKKAKKEIPSAYLLILLLGGATVLWGVLTCTWFGIEAQYLPAFLQKISIPVISNVYADKLWYPFWTGGSAGLTTSQNLQIFCFTLALVQLTVAHIMGAAKNRKSLKCLGDIGSVLQLLGIYYVVLSLVVNGEVFGLGLVIGGVPVGTVAIALVGVGFVMSFIFANYDGSLKESVLSSCKNIVSVLLGVVNVFSDIVSYIRLWAVGLAGAAISATVNELAGPMLGKLTFIIFAIILLIFGHGLNMILNVLSVIVHGVRLNTLEFSSHLDMSWSGHKYKPFEE